MRLSTLLSAIAIALVAGFVALNVDEFTRTSTLSLGLATVQAPLGLVILGLLVLASMVFIVSTLYLRSRRLHESNLHNRELTAQRDLADKAEASRFTELRSFLQAQAEEAHQRESAMGAVLADRFAQQQQILLARMEQLDKGLHVQRAQPPAHA